MNDNDTTHKLSVMCQKLSELNLNTCDVMKIAYK